MKVYNIEELKNAAEEIGFPCDLTVSNSASLAGYVCLVDRWLDIAKKLDELSELFEHNKKAKDYYAACAASYRGCMVELNDVLNEEQT